MNNSVTALIERYGFVDFERSLDFLSEAYVVTHQDTTAQQALTDLERDVKTLLGKRFGLFVDVAWPYISPALTGHLRTAIDTAIASGAAPSEEQPVAPQSSGG